MIADHCAASAFFLSSNIDSVPCCVQFFWNRSRMCPPLIFNTFDETSSSLGGACRTGIWLTFAPSSPYRNTHWKHIWGKVLPPQEALFNFRFRPLPRGSRLLVFLKCSNMWKYFRHACALRRWSLSLQEMYIFSTLIVVQRAVLPLRFWRMGKQVTRP